MNKLTSNLAKIKFFNSHLKSLPILENEDNKPKATPRVNYAKVLPTPLINPRLLSLSDLACRILDIEYKDTLSDSDSASFLSGNKLLSNSIPISHCYCGHQFGVFAGQLGDGTMHLKLGRAITLGDTFNKKNELWELQLKGSGKTPYSRFADGRAVLRSSIREYLCSEHLYSLGIPTTRALGIVVSDSEVMRDLLYDNHPIMEKCAVVLRLSNTFQRFGSFEIFKDFDTTSGSKGPSFGYEKEMITHMLYYLSKYHFSNIHLKYFKNDTNIEVVNKIDIFPKECAKEIFNVILARTAFMAATWQAFGFCHGVLNTDNMSIQGVTIDYGPFGFVEYFDKEYICNHSDKNGRYSYKNQPRVCMWNMKKLSEAWNFVVPTEETTKIVDETYNKIYFDCFYSIMRFKLGLFLKNVKEDKALIDEMFELLNEFGFDYTIFMRKLEVITMEEKVKENEELNNLDLDFVDCVMQYSMDYEYLENKNKPKMNPVMLAKLYEISKYSPNILYSYGLKPEDIENEYLRLIKQNQLKEKNITPEQFELTKLEKLKGWLHKYKYRLQKEVEFFIELKCGKEHDEAYNLKENFLIRNNISTIQPFSEFSFKDIYSLVYDNFDVKKIDDVKAFARLRKQQMKALNPKIILRNYLAQKAIEEAEKGNYKETDRILSLLTDPFSDHLEFEEEKLFATSLEKAFSICVSCSS